jgi:adenylate cyclase
MIQLGSTVFDLSAHMLRDSAGAKIALRAQSARVLECLIEAQGALLSKEQLFKAVWADVSVTDDSLVQCIREIRTAIGDAQHAVLQTEARRGYRLVLNGHGDKVTDGHASMPAALSPSTPNADGQITPAIAVMAFTSMDGDERSERLAMTFAGDLLTELARHKELRIIGRFASFALMGQALSSKEVCAKLNARYIVSGQVQFTETTIQWSLEMMDGHTDETVWSERKQVKFTDLYAETAALNGRIAGTINANINVFTWRRAMASTPESLNAYDLCARITAMGLNCTVQGMRDAQLLAARAVALYPNYARAWHAAASVHLFDINQCLTGDWTDAHIPQALQEAHKAIELDSSHAMAYGGLATLLLLNGQHKEAMLSSRRAMDLGPGDPMIVNVHAFILFHTGRFEQSKKIAASMIGVGPLRLPLYLANYAKALLVLGEHHEAIELMQEALVTTPGFNAARAALIVALEETGLHGDAMKHYELLMANSNGFNQSFSGRRWDAIPEVLSRYLTAFQAQGMQAEK